MGVRTDPADPLKEREDPDEIPLLGCFFNTPVVIGKVKLEAYDLFAVRDNPEIDRFLEGRMVRPDRNHYFGHFSSPPFLFPRRIRRGGGSSPSSGDIHCPASPRSG